jgi:single-strand DNA-binding protein
MIAGRLGRDAEYKTTANSELCSFSVAADVGFGDNKQTYWVDVTKWGKGAQGLSGILKKGSSVAVTGELTTREHNGKTYLQCRADDVTILGTTPQRGQQPTPAPTPAGGGYDDLDDDIPF